MLFENLKKMKHGVLNDCPKCRSVGDWLGFK